LGYKGLLLRLFLELFYWGFFPFALQGGLVPNKISGVGTNFGLLVRDLSGPNKQRKTTRSKTKHYFVLNLETNESARSPRSF
jgi:hypothetical protein